ncbi:MAG: radical SAM protein [Candidatus Omnitrophota bacterium]
MKIKFVHSDLQALGIEYLSAILKKNGHNVDLIIDPMFPFLKAILNPLKKILQLKEKLLRNILSNTPDIVAFSVTIHNFEWACQLANEIKKYSNAFIVFGGIQATLLPEVIFQKVKADFVIRGEAEYVFMELVQSLESDKKWHKIKNLCFQDKEKIIINPLRELINNLDELPFPDKDILPGWFNKKAYRIITSRGCIGECSYCCAPILKEFYKGLGSKIRRRSVDNVIEELTLAPAKYNIRKVFFEDDLFTFDKKWVREFTKQYAKKVNLPCLIHATPETLDLEMIELLKEMNCSCVEIGVQSLNPEIRQNLLSRYYSNGKIVEIIETLKQKGIICICDNIVGLPQEKLSDIKAAIKFYAKLKPGKIEVLRLEFYPQASIIEMSNLAKKDKERINNGELFISKGSNYKKVSKMLLLIGLSYILPAKSVNFLLRKHLFNIFPFFDDFNHVNEFIYYFSAFFKKNKKIIFISYRNDLLDKIKYVFKNILEN